MTRKQKSVIICGNLIRKFDWLKSQETVLIATVMDSLKTIEKTELHTSDKWKDVSYYPREHEDIIVMDTDGKLHDNHYWCGHAYYQYIRYDDVCDGYPSDVKIKKWRYK